MKLKNVLLTFGLASVVAAGAVAGLSMKGEPVEAEAGDSTSTIYVDVTAPLNNFWGSEHINDVGIYLFGGNWGTTEGRDWASGTAFIYYGFDSWDTMHVNTKTYVTFNLDNWSSATGMIVYCYGLSFNDTNLGRQTDNIAFTETFPSSQNLVTVSNSNSWGSKHGHSVGTLYIDEVTVDISGENWNDSSTGQNISVYFWNGGSNGWGTYVFASQYQALVRVKYYLPFVPANMKAGRWSGQHSESAWEGSDRWNTYCWAQTNNLDYKSAEMNIIIAGDKGTVSVVCYPFVHGGIDSGGWNTLVVLSNVRMNHKNEIVYYNDLELTSGSTYKFGVKIYNWSVYYSWHAATIADSAKDGCTWSLSGERDLCAWVGGGENLTIRINFNRSTEEIYINTPEYDLADQWGYKFIDEFVCEDDAIKTDTWDDMQAAYEAINDEDTYAIMENAEYHAPNEDLVDYYARGLQRYDHVLKRYGVTDHEDFIGRLESIPGPIGRAGGLLISNVADNTIIIVASSVILLVAVGGFFFLRRKKEQ